VTITSTLQREKGNLKLSEPGHITVQQNSQYLQRLQIISGPQHHRAKGAAGGWREVTMFMFHGRFGKPRAKHPTVKLSSVRADDLRTDATLIISQEGYLTLPRRVTEQNRFEPRMKEMQ